MGAIEDDPCGEIVDAKEETEADEPGEEAEGWEVHRARQLAPAHLAKRGQNHYLISTFPRAEALKMHRLGVAGALWIALIGALLLAGVLAMR